MACGPGHGALQASPARVARPGRPSSGRAPAAGAGWSLRATVAQGDCGIDAMAYWEGRPRTPETWQRVRLELAAAMVALRGCTMWQDAYIGCEGGRGVFVTAGGEEPPKVKRLRVEAVAPEAVAHADSSFASGAVGIMGKGWSSQTGTSSTATAATATASPRTVTSGGRPPAPPLVGEAVVSPSDADVAAFLASPHPV